MGCDKHSQSLAIKLKESKIHVGVSTVEKDLTKKKIEKKKNALDCLIFEESWDCQC